MITSISEQNLINHIILPRELEIYQQQLTVAEYFAGIGLVRLGLELAGWRVIFANDFSFEKYEMYASYFDNADKHYLVKDVFKIDPKCVPTTLLATASFPCIDLSLAGNLNGINAKHSSAFWGFIDILKAQGESRPRLVLLENVNGWLASNRGKDFRITIQALNSLGYACDMLTVDAIRFTPQSRPRIFVIGMQMDSPNRDVLKLIRRSESIATKALKNAMESNFDLDWHILDIPEPPAKKSDGLAEIVEILDVSDPRWWPNEEVERHIEMMHEKHYDRILKYIDNKEFIFRTMYRRVRQSKQRAEVRANDTAGCLRTARGGSSRQMLVQVGKGYVRMRHMTPREYARLQGVPDDYPIPEQINKSLTGFGDAVCVPVVQWIAENVLTPVAIQMLEK